MKIVSFLQFIYFKTFWLIMLIAISTFYTTFIVFNTFLVTFLNHFKLFLSMNLNLLSPIFIFILKVMYTYHSLSETLTQDLYTSTTTQKIFQLFLIIL